MNILSYSFQNPKRETEKVREREREKEIVQNTELQRQTKIK